MRPRRRDRGSRRPARLLLPLLALLVLSCASADRLARQSDVLLARGDLRGAYEHSRRALDKDAGNANARAAYAAAAGQLSGDYQGRVLRLAAVDTVGAARVALDYRDLRAEIARYPVEVTPSSYTIQDMRREGSPQTYLTLEARILTGAARQCYRDGDAALAASHPKEAWRRFTDAMRFQPDYRDVANRVAQSYDRALTRVAVLPFDDQIGVPGLPEALQHALIADLANRSGSPAFRFTRVLSADDIEARMTVAQSRGMTRDVARSLGRALGAQRVVCGRISGLRTDNDRADWRFPIYHNDPTTDADGQTVDRWLQSMLHVVSHARHVQASATYEVIDVRTGVVLATATQPYEGWARVVWSDYAAEGDCARYRLAPPTASTTDADAAQRQWDDDVHGMSLADLLEKARAGDRRQRWDGRYRHEFPRDSREHPLFLGELPPETDMAYLALQDAWQPVLEALRTLDSQD